MAAAAKVLIMSASAGAGHTRAAQAIEEAFRARYPAVEVRHIDALDYTNAAFRRSFRGAYNVMVTRFPRLWGLLYEKTDSEKGRTPLARLATMLDRLNCGWLRAFVREFDPDAIVTTHFLGAEVFGPLRRKGKLRATLGVVITDFEMHSVWAAEKADAYFAGNEAVSCGLSARGVCGKVTVTGIPIMAAFAGTPPAKDEIRAKLGIRIEPVTILVSAGGFGMMPVDEAVSLIVDSAPGAQVLAVAGKNDKLRLALEALAREREGNVVPFGFVTNMHELMAASDLAVAKSGGLTSSECLAMGLPMVIWNPIPGQEERNADYLLENGAALRANSPAHLAFKVKKLLGDAELLARMQQAARQIARPHAAYDIVDEVMSSL